MTTHGEDRKRKPHQDEGYQKRWQKPRQGKHEEIIVTKQECIKMQRDKTSTQGKSFHGATKEINMRKKRWT